MMETLSYREQVSQSRWAAKRLQEKLLRPEVTHKCAGRVLPSGYFSLGFVPRPRPSRQEKHLPGYAETQRFERRYIRLSEVDSGGVCLREQYKQYFFDKKLGRPTPLLSPPVASPPEVPSGPVKRSDPFMGLTGQATALENGRQGGGEQFPPTSDNSLGLSSIQRCRGTKREGLKGITNYGRRQISEGCFVLERSFFRRGLGMYTFTCPYTDDSDVVAFAENWATILKRLLERISRLYATRGQKLHYVGCVELQEKRYKRSGQICPHLHFIANCRLPGNKEFIVSADELRQIWQEVCKNATKKIVPVGASVDCSVVRKSAEAYLSKYMSKGGEIVEECAESFPQSLPRRWWCISKSLRLVIKTRTRKLTGCMAEFLIQQCYQGMDSGIFVWVKSIFISLHGQEVCIGFCGKLDTQNAEVFVGKQDFLADL